MKYKCKFKRWRMWKAFVLYATLGYDSAYEIGSLPKRALREERCFLDRILMPVISPISGLHSEDSREPAKDFNK
jgi:hypothetical protein